MLIIGNSGHGRDIAATIPGSRLIAHHKLWNGERPFIIGINDPHIRWGVAREIGPGFTWIHPTVYLGIESDVGQDSHINYGTMMTRTIIGDGCTIGPRVTFGGDVTLGDRVFVGMGALIGVKHPGGTITIGDDAIIGAGALVLKDVQAGAKVLGLWA